ncbi:MAG: SGNH/GDSL hydrolase family protein [Acholeplasmataceae bacterium]|nr:SGNH/GDSL hydrolase family protein [Acholeplasmataceae bacterium]
MNQLFKMLVLLFTLGLTLLLVTCMRLEDVPEIRSVELDPSTQKDVYGAETFDLSSLELLVTMEDGTVKTVIVRESMVEEEVLEQLLASGNHVFTITYEGFSTEVTVKILADGLPSTLLSIYELGLEADLIDMTYEQWVESIRGEDGDPGIGIQSILINGQGELIITMTDETVLNLGHVMGEDGLTPMIGENGHWWIGDTDTGINAQGIDGHGIESISLSEEDELIMTITGGEIVNLGRISEDTDHLYEMLKTFFDIEEDAFVMTSKTPGNPSRNYTTSTFSGWGGSIGQWGDSEVIRFKIKSRDLAITKVKVFITENDKNGEVLYSEMIDTSIDPFTEAYVDVIPNDPLGVFQGKELYLTYNCNQLCDVYSDFSSASILPESAYQAQMTYATAGRLLEHPSEMIDVSSPRTNYLSVEFGKFLDLLTLNAESESLIREAAIEPVNVHLAQRYHLVAGDTFQLFFRGVIEAIDPYDYHISISMSKGFFYPRYYEWTPSISDVGEYPLTISVYDHAGHLLGRDNTVLDVAIPRVPERDYTILAIGDSLTSGGYWVAEGYRRFAKEGGNPVGLGYDHLNFIGTKSTTYNGVTVRHEGYGGWTWAKFMSTDSPFYDHELGEINFQTYVERHDFQDIDEVYVLLTWNGMGANMTYDQIEQGHMAQARGLIERIHRDYPNARIRCLGIQIPSQNGGTGANYGVGGYADAYGLLVTAFRYNDKLEELCLSEAYRDFVTYGDVKAQFDTDYNMPQTEVYVNTRSTLTETRGTNGVHPAIGGYMQIADVFYRMLCHDFEA